MIIASLLLYLESSIPDSVTITVGFEWIKKKMSFL